MPLPSTFFEAWRSAQERFYPKRIAQQPPSETFVLGPPIIAEAIIFTGEIPVQTYWTQFQYPMTQAPVPPVPVEISAFDSTEQQLGQYSFELTQYPATQSPVFVPVVAAEFTFFECNSVQVFVPVHAQQPQSESAPVFVTVTATTTIEWDAPISRAPYLRVVAQQPPSRAGPDLVIINESFVVPTYPASVFHYQKRVAQQPPSDTSPLRGCPVLLGDWYSDDNQSNNQNMRAGSNEGYGQTFTARAGTLDRAVFSLNKQGLPTGTLTAEIFDVTATYGQSSCKPTGAALAVSESLDVSTLTTSSTLTTFNFTGAQRIALANQYYAVVLHFVPTFSDISNVVRVNNDNSSASHSGNEVFSADYASWGGNTGRDVVFYVYEVICQDVPTFFDAPQAQVRPKAVAQQPPSETAPPRQPTVAETMSWQAAPQAQVRARVWAQQPPSLTAPVFTEYPPETYFEDWQEPRDRYYPKAVAQQPPSETAPPRQPTVAETMSWQAAPQAQVRARVWAQQPPSLTQPVFVEFPPETFFEDWQEPRDRYYPKAVAQQPPSEAAPPRQPTVAETLAWIAPQAQVRPKAVAQQPPSATAPVFVEFPPVEQFLEDFTTPNDRYLPLARAQQPDSLTQPVTLPTPTVAQSMAWEAPQMQVRPRIWAQQPPSEAGLVLTPGTVVPPPWFEVVQAQVRARIWSQQPPSETKPVATLPRQWFDMAPQAQVRPKAVAQQPPSLVAPVFVEYPPVEEFLEDFTTPNDRYYPKAVPQQPPSEAAPPRQPSVAQTLEWIAPQAQVRPKAVAQQPPSETAPVSVPVAPTFFDAPQAQVRPKAIAQQPPSISEPLRGCPVLVADWWGTENGDSTVSIRPGITEGVGQSFTGRAGVLNSIKFQLGRVGAPTGTIVAELYAHSGTYGKTGIPTGAVLATSEVLDIATFTPGLVTFNFVGSQRVAMANQYYVIVLHSTFTFGDGSNRLEYALTASATPRASGNGVFINTWAAPPTGWSTDARDTVFYVYEVICQDVPTFFDAPQAQVRARIWAQQPPSLIAPVATLPRQWFDMAPQAQVRPKAVAQQPPSETAPFRQAAPAPDFFEDPQQQVFPRIWAQQPPSDTRDLALPRPSVAQTLAWLAPQVQVFPRIWAQQPPSYVAPVLLIPGVTPPTPTPTPEEPGGGGHPPVVVISRAPAYVRPGITPAQPQPELDIPFAMEGEARARLVVTGRPSLIHGARPSAPPARAYVHGRPSAVHAEAASMSASLVTLATPDIWRPTITVSAHPRFEIAMRADGHTMLHDDCEDRIEELEGQRDAEALGFDLIG